MDETTPFLSVDDVAAMLAPRLLSTGERTLVGLLVTTAAEWIRDPSRCPDLPTSSSAAKLVTYDVVVEALGPESGIGRKVRSVTRATDDRSTTVAYAEAVALMDLNQERYSQLLGLSMTAEPRGTFDSFDTAFVDADPCGRRAW